MRWERKLRSLRMAGFVGYVSGGCVETAVAAWRGGEVKPTARSKPAAKRERRRPDPLLADSAELPEWFEAEPWRTSREFLERLQVKHPGLYPDGLIRTVQRPPSTPDGEGADIAE